MSIPTSVIVVLLVIAWLVVLVPMIARRRERVPQAEPGSSTFRVLRRASATLRRRPVKRAKARAAMPTAGHPDGAPAACTEVLATVGAGHQQPADAAEEWAAAQSAQRVPRPPLTVPDLEVDLGDHDVAGRAGDDQVEDDQDIDDGNGAYVTGRSAGQAHPADERSAGDRPVADVGPPARIAPAALVEQVGTDEHPADDSAAEEVAERSRIPDEIDEQEWADHVAAAPGGGNFDEVDDVQLRPVPHRPGRGGFDPDAAEATRAYRYQQRRRVTLILVVATVVCTSAAILLVSWLWFGAVASLALLVGYLAYLRRQVRIEASIRQKRMERLQRARQIRPEYARAPRRTRGGLSAVQPGRSVVDLDDDDPSFDELEDFQQPLTYRRAAGQ